MTTYSHSGCLGDVIYSLPVIRAVAHYRGEPGEIILIENGVADAIKKYGNGPVPDAYVGKLTQKEISLLTPLLMEQQYIGDVSSGPVGTQADINLDEFRRTVGASFTGNFLETYFKTFGIGYTADDIVKPWLTVNEPKHVANNVICRTMRYRSNRTSTIPTWLKLLRSGNVEESAVFIGHKDEYEDFVQQFDTDIPHYVCKDFLEMAQVIAGANAFYGNQTFAYGIAQGLGKRTYLETLTWRPLHQNECFFPRIDCFYF